MSNENHAPTKSELLDVILAERTRFEKLLDGLTNAKLTEAGVEASWSIKDILAHIAAWERLAHDRIHAAESGGLLKYPLIKGDADVDAFNQAIYDKYKAIPISEVMAEFKDSHRDFMAQIDLLDDEFLNKPLPFDWAGKLTTQVLISANTHWHYIEHADSILKWLEK